MEKFLAAHGHYTEQISMCSYGVAHSAAVDVAGSKHSPWICPQKKPWARAAICGKEIVVGQAGWGSCCPWGQCWSSV